MTENVCYKVNWTNRVSYYLNNKEIKSLKFSQLEYMVIIVYNSNF